MPHRADLDLQPDQDRDAERWFADIYREQSPWLIRFLRRQLGNVEDAQDLAHDTMLRFLRAAPMGAVAAPQAYLRRIATNLLRDRFEHSMTRMDRASTPLIDGLDFEAEVDQHRTLSDREELARWEAIIEELRPRTMEIFLLSRLDGRSYKEIAEHLGMTVWNVKRHMRIAIAHITQRRSE